MKAILIKYLPATNARDARIKATTESGSITESRDYNIEPLDQAQAIAEQYCQSTWDDMEVTGFGTLPNGDWCATVGWRV
tara:strand:- start:4725 stop:4961 length:237 start_codon:yes stop_codon:yes gene_type:complete